MFIYPMRHSKCGLSISAKFIVIIWCSWKIMFLQVFLSIQSTRTYRNPHQFNSPSFIETKFRLDAEWMDVMSLAWFKYFQNSALENDGPLLENVGPLLEKCATPSLFHKICVCFQNILFSIKLPLGIWSFCVSPHTITP